MNCARVLSAGTRDVGVCVPVTGRERKRATAERAGCQPSSADLLRRAERPSDLRLCELSYPRVDLS